MRIGIRPAQGEDDLGFMLGLGRRLADAIRTANHAAADIEAFQDEYSAANLGNPPSDAFTVIAIGEEGLRLGFAHALPGHDGITGEAIGYVALLAVIEAAEGTGVAGRLLDAVRDWARRRGYRSLSLDVFASNGRGRRFYEKNGFEPESIRMVEKL